MLEQQRDGKEVLYIANEHGPSVWVHHDYMLHLLGMVFGQIPSRNIVHGFEVSKKPKTLTSYIKWIQGCDALVVMKNHAQPRWWMTGKIFQFVSMEATHQAMAPEEEAENG